MSVLNPGLLDRAADIMDARGLARLAYFDADGPVCILGAIAIARGYKPFEWGPSVDEDIFVEEPLSELAVLMRTDPVLFSDDEAVDASEVSAALREAAGLLLAAKSRRLRGDG